MKRLKILLLTVILLTAASACNTSETDGTELPDSTSPPPTPTLETAETPTASAGENSLVGTRWTLESFGPTASEEPVIEGSTITLEFESAEQVVGSGGCNSYGGDYTIQDDMISFGQIVSTEIACTEQGVTEQEQQYFEALQTAGLFTQSAERLTILYNDGQSLLNFVPADS